MYNNGMEKEVFGRIHSIETFGSLDGPGIRFVIFLKGCAMRCLFCHNVDTWDPNGGELKSVTQLLDMAERYRAYWGKDGGITVSGGEPLLQTDFMIALFKEAKNRGINTCIDTAGQPFTRKGVYFEKFQELMKYTDLLMVDIKHIDPIKHKELTAQPNENILDMLRYLDEIGKRVWIRQVLLEGFTDVDEYLYKTRAFIKALHNVERVEVLPFHKMGEFKWEKLGIEYKLKDTQPPSKERVENATDILTGKKDENLI